MSKQIVLDAALEFAFEGWINSLRTSILWIAFDSCYIIKIYEIKSVLKTEWHLSKLKMTI